ncbi:MAG: RNA-binding protein [Deltaproteobacteria bacterium]|jgi:RNA recognition motif-containing protein|nr:RNA-binding protein [Deltaproteobacteria bacterium]
MIDLFVANFPYDTKHIELMTIFSRFGEVESVKIITDHFTGFSKGFGFVRMEKEAGQAAIAALNMANFGGRALTVREALPLPPKKMGSADVDLQPRARRFEPSYGESSYEPREREYVYRY